MAVTEDTSNHFLKVLVVDDDAQIRLVVKEGLGHGRACLVSTAPDGDAGIRKMEESTPDVLLLDMLMPDSDGFTVLEHIHDRGEGSRPGRVIAMSGLRDPETVAAIMAMGADAVLPKPFTLGDLRSACGEPRQVSPLR